MAGEFDFGGFGDLGNFSIGGGDSGGGFPIDPGGFNLGGGALPGPLEPGGGGGFNLGGSTMPGGGPIFDPGTLPTSPDVGGQDPGLGQRVAGTVKNTLQPFADVAKAVSPLVGLGTAGVGMAAGIQGAQTSAQQARLARQAQQMQKQTLQAQQAAAAPLTQFGSQELQDAQAGKIPAAIQAQIDNWATGAKQKAADYAARSGQGNSTMLTQWNAWIDQQAKAMAADYIQKEQALGIQSLQAGAQGLTSAGSNAASLQQGAVQQQGGIAALMDAANKALAQLSAGAA